MKNQMNGTLTLNTKNYTIEMDKKFATAASNVFSAEYEKLQEVRRDYPNYKVVTIVRKEKTSGTSGLTFEFMELYIEQHDDEEKSLMAAFKALRATDEDGKALGMKSKSYLTIRAWFLNAFPEVENAAAKREQLLKDIREKREAAAKAKKEAEMMARRAALLAKISKMA
ncbi:MAG: hypothetical protein E7331_11635 [Clostridiales bacterium]|nr:hypothetical protein [Clostridiales bacterium]